MRRPSRLQLRGSSQASSSPELEIASGQKRQSGPARRRAKAQGAASGSQRACSRRALVLVADDGTCRWRDALASPDGAALLALLQQKRQEAALGSLRYAQAPLMLPIVASAACASAVALEQPDGLAGPLAGHPAAQKAIVAAFRHTSHR